MSFNFSILISCVVRDEPYHLETIAIISTRTFLASSCIIHRCENPHPCWAGQAQKHLSTCKNHIYKIKNFQINKGRNQTNPKKRYDAVLGDKDTNIKEDKKRMVSCKCVRAQRKVIRLSSP